jgi:AAA domain
LDIGAHIALGDPWQGRFVSQGSVVFFVGEGENGLGKRREAWEIVNGKSLDDAKFFYIDAVPNFVNASDVKSIIASLESIPKPIRLIVIDTRSQHTAGSEENSNEVVALFIRNLIDIRKATGAAVIYVHHTGHGDQERGRGASSGFANIDLSILIKQSGDGIVISQKKCKDWQPPEPMAAVVKPVGLGYHSEQTQEEETSAVLSYLSVIITQNLNKMDTLLAESIKQTGSDNRETIRGAFYQLHGGETAAAKKAFQRAWMKYLASKAKDGA